MSLSNEKIQEVIDDCEKQVVINDVAAMHVLKGSRNWKSLHRSALYYARKAKKYQAILNERPL